MGENESEKEDKMTARNGSGEWHGNARDGAGTVTVWRRTSHLPPSEGEAPAFVTSQRSLASYAVVTWHRHGKAGQ
jgi:hypothetical protein